MLLLAHLSIRRKLARVTMLATGPALVLAAIAFVGQGWFNARWQFVSAMSSTARMAGLATARAIANGDAAQAEQALQSLAAQPDVLVAGVYDRTGASVATYRRSGHAAVLPPERLQDERAKWEGNQLELVRRLEVPGGQVFIFLRAEASELTTQLVRSLLLGALIVLVAGGLACVSGSRLHRAIAEPVSRLAAQLRDVTNENDPSSRTVPLGGDEISAMTAGFDALRVQLGARDDALREAQQEVERRVEERTRMLANSIALINATLDSTTDGIIAVDFAGRVVCYNSRFLAMWKLPPELMARGDRWEIARFLAAQSRDPDGFMRLVVETTDHAEAAACHVIELVDGQTIERHAHPQRVGGRMVGVVVSYRDITERRQAQEQLAREKARLQFIFDSVPMGISLRSVERNGKHTRLMNDEHLRICGLTSEQLSEPGIFRKISHPDDYDRQMKLHERLSAREFDRFAIEKRYLHANGDVVWVTFCAQRRYFDDGSYEELCTVVDISEVKRAHEHVAREQAQFKFIFDSAPVGICLQRHRSDGRQEGLLNDAYLRICGVERREAELEVFKAITHPDDRAQQAVLHQQLDQGLVGRFSFEKRYLRRDDGQTVWVVYSVQRQRFDDGSYQDLSTIVDITELKRAQEQVAVERARFKFIFESVPIGISLIMPGVEESNLVNPAHERITGITEEELTKPGAFERATHPDDWKRHHALVKSYKSGAIDRFTLEKRYVHAGGKIVWVSLTRRMFTDSTTGQQYSITTLADITDLKAAQEDVARERARFKFIFEAVPVGISWMVPGNDETHIVNPAHERITGVSAEDSRKPLAFARVSHPGDYQRQRELVPKFINGEIDQYSVEKRYLHPDGRIVWAVLTSRMFTDPATGVKQSVTTLVDITDVKQAQEAMLRQQARFKFIFDAVPVGFTWMVCDRIDTRIVNPAHARITGVPMEHCHELKRYWDATHPDDRTQQRALHDRLLAGEIDHYEMEKRYMHPDGTVAWCVVAIRFYRDEATRETQEITTVVDITERKQAEARLAETHRQLLETSRQAGMAEVATGVLHNVGNVLNSVNVSTTMLTDLVRQSKIDKLARFAELLLQQPDLGAFFRDDPRGRKVPSFVQTLSTHLGREQAELLGELESLRKNVEHIKDIVAMQQSYARVCGVSEEIGVVELIEDALRMNAGAFVRHDIAIVRQFEVQPIVTVEKHKVLQILVNLMRNAKYACDDSGRADKQMIIRVWMEHGRVKIAVSDNGVGIPPENLTRIFSHGFTTRKHGHGFGLHSGAIVAKELGGAIHAHSDGPGLGATFILELPHNPDAKAA